MALRHCSRLPAECGCGAGSAREEPQDCRSGLFVPGEQASEPSCSPPHPGHGIMAGRSESVGDCVVAGARVRRDHPDLPRRESRPKFHPLSCGSSQEDSSFQRHERHCEMDRRGLIFIECTPLASGRSRIHADRPKPQPIAADCRRPCPLLPVPPRWTNIQPAQAGNYSVLVANVAGSVTSTVATLTVTQPAVPPAITVQPQSRTNSVGTTATFTVMAAGTAPLSYQWRFNGSNLLNGGRGHECDVRGDRRRRSADGLPVAIQRLRSPRGDRREPHAHQYRACGRGVRRISSAMLPTPNGRCVRRGG